MATFRSGFQSLCPDKRNNRSGGSIVVAPLQTSRAY